MSRLYLVTFFCLTACAAQPDAARLQGHLTQAGASTGKTDTYIGHVRNRLETIDYKSGRAIKLLDKGFAK